MALPAPNLDDRSFQSLVDEAKRRISNSCPEWTDHNVSDPGVTLIELFAYMTEIILYRLNQVPERNYIKFLEMIGISLKAGNAARTGVTFPLSAGWQGGTGEQVVISRGTGIATEPAGEEDPIVFSTDRELVLAHPVVQHVLRETGSAIDVWNPSTGPFRIWNPDRPQIHDAVYFGFDRDITGYLLELTLFCQPGATTNLVHSNPQGEWQYLDRTEGHTGAWKRLPIATRTVTAALAPGEPVVSKEIEQDTTRGLGAETGTVLFQIPWETFDPKPQKRNELDAWWIRYVYNPVAYEYVAAPVLTQKPRCRVLAGTVSASHCARADNEILGQSDGTPGQTFRLPIAPILALEDGERIEVELESGGWEPWFRQDDFATSGKDDPHVTIDTGTGEVRFGPNILKPNGAAQQMGAIPPAGMKIRMTAYRYGGGIEGNLAAGKLTQLRRTFSYIVPTANDPLLQITNPHPAQGGSNREELVTAKLRAQKMLRSMERAVTAEDYEYQARQAKKGGIARARCIMPAYPSTDRHGNPAMPPGLVVVLVVPAVAGDPADGGLKDKLVVTRSLQQDITRHLDERRPITARVVVAPPSYVRIKTVVNIQVDPRFSPLEVRRNVERALHTYVNPLVGGDQNDGWPFEHPVRYVDLRVVIQQVAGVRAVVELQVFYRRESDRTHHAMELEEIVLAPTELVLSEQHDVRIAEPDRRSTHARS